MAIWTVEIKEIERVNESFKGQGYKTGQEVIFDLFLFFGTSQNLTSP